MLTTVQKVNTKPVAVSRPTLGPGPAPPGSEPPRRRLWSLNRAGGAHAAPAGQRDVRKTKKRYKSNRRSCCQD